MFTVKRDDKGLLVVVENFLTFHDTTQRTWKFNTEHWWRTLSGKETEIPVSPMSDIEIEWVKKYYLPKLEEVHQ